MKLFSAKMIMLRLFMLFKEDNEKRNAFEFSIIVFLKFGWYFIVLKDF